MFKCWLDIRICFLFSNTKFWKYYLKLFDFQILGQIPANIIKYYLIIFVFDSNRLYTPSFCHTFSYFLNFWHIFSGFWPTFWSFGHTSSTFTHILKFSHNFSYFLMPCQFLHTFSCFLSILHTFLKFYTFSQHSDTNMKAIYVNRAYNTIWLKIFGYLSGTLLKLLNAFV